MKRSKILMLCLLCGICVIGICVKQSLRKKFYDYNVIAHAGGGIDGHIYTDSLEAVNINLQYATDEKIQEIRKKGIKIFWAVENDLKEYQEKYLGDGVVSDWITENQINELLK